MHSPSRNPRRASNPFHEAPDEPDAPPKDSEVARRLSGFEEHGERRGPSAYDLRNFEHDELEAKGLFLRGAPVAEDAPQPPPVVPGTQRRAEDEGDTRTADQRLLDDVSEYLFMGDLDTTDLELTVASGTVTLTGTVSSQAASRNLEQLVSAVPGVTRVESQLKVSRPARQPRTMPVRAEPPAAQPSWPNQFTTTWASPPTR